MPNSTVSNPGNFLRRDRDQPVPGLHALAVSPTARRNACSCSRGNNNCTENLNLYHSGIPETTRAGIFGRGTLRDIGGGLTAFAELGFNSNETFTQSPPFAVPSSQIGPGVARARSRRSCPWATTPTRSACRSSCATASADVGPRQIINTTDATRVVAGMAAAGATGAGRPRPDYTRASRAEGHEQHPHLRAASR